ncbi:MAG: hypothetical protein R3297_01285 [Desulfobulbales bacterium]|nr:hypothetical protein [Desulfobulbales bacterium]
MIMGKDMIATIEPRGEIYTCPACGYTDGFHVSFKVHENNKDADICLICPNCHSRYELGWQVRLKSSD